MWEDKQIALAVLLATIAPAQQNPLCILASLVHTQQEASILVLYAQVVFLAPALTSQWSSLVQTEPTPLVVLLIAPTALEASNVTTPLETQSQSVLLVTTRSKETWTVILVLPATHVL